MDEFLEKVDKLLSRQCIIDLLVYNYGVLRESIEELPIDDLRYLLTVCYLKGERL
jgi:hypothetical protein